MRRHVINADIRALGEEVGETGGEKEGIGAWLAASTEELVV
jgi:hypothetical protein